MKTKNKENLSNDNKDKETNFSKKKGEVVENLSNEKDCPIHGNLKVRGRVFEGHVIRKFPKRVTIWFERMVYVRKYERYKKSRTKIHARLPPCMESIISVGDLIKIQECRPLSKIIHFVVIEKVKDAKEEIRKKNE